jgi:hypothetical protein
LCDPVSTTLGALDLGKKALNALAPKIPQLGSPPQPEQPPPSQAAQLPDQQLLRKRMQAAMLGAGPMSTMLTGPRGVATSSLNLGKNTLLGA